ncbi:MAG TPA: bacitracin ABC transporter ATP-binding protein [Lachnospiraceae bacterium]|nr:bacitracin ABC transporter ATP-binding protein [Lachnospiraceae bacterium]
MDVLTTENLTKTYRGRNVVDNVNMHVKKGDIYGFIGRNGAGKTTLMKMVCGLTRTSSGEFELFGSKNLGEGRKKIGCVIEQPALYPGMTAQENLIYYSKMQGCEKTTDFDALLQLVGLPDTGKKKAKKFSLGMKQRLSIAIALLGEPDFLVLDEPMNGLDPAGIREIREMLLNLHEKRQITILMSSHILGELGKIATKYGIINSGRLVEEFSAKELEERSKHFLHITADDSDRACQILTQECEVEKYKIMEDQSICVYDRIEEPAAINQALVQNNVMVSYLAVEGQDMEMYFVERMGGM